MKTELEIVKDLMSKHNLTAKDLFSFCICAVNFLEYYDEEAMCDVMWNCPERYCNADSDNTKAVAGALNGEKKAEKWTDEDQFAHYMRNIQETVESDKDDLSHFLEEFPRFKKVYKREIMVPIMLGCPVNDYDDSRFDDEDYIKSIVNVDNLTLHRAYEERRKAEVEAYKKREAEKLAKEVEEHADDEDFSVLLASCTDVARLQQSFEEYNQRYYPKKDYKVIPMKNPQYMIIQTGGKSIEEVKDRILNKLERCVIILGHEMQKELIPVEKAFQVVPQVLFDNKVTHVVTYI